MTHSLQHSLFFKDLRCATYICKSTSINAKRPFLEFYLAVPCSPSCWSPTSRPPPPTPPTLSTPPAHSKSWIFPHFWVGLIYIVFIFILYIGPHWIWEHFLISVLELQQAESFLWYLMNLIFSAMVTLVMFCLFSVICDGPGYVPLKWKKGNKSKSRSKFVR